MNSSTGTTPCEVGFGCQPQIPVNLKLGYVRDNNDLCQSDFCQSFPNLTHVTKKTSRSFLHNFLSPKNLMDSHHREIWFKNIYRKVCRKIREANHRSHYRLHNPEENKTNANLCRHKAIGDETLVAP